jgi:ABC-type sugar transport system ATPase subunit
LTNKEIEQLFMLMRKLKADGKSLIYISHKLEEIYEITDRVTVYRDGEFIGTSITKDLPMSELIRMMVGRNVDEMFPKIPCDIGDVKLEVKNLSYGKTFKDVSFQVRKGEIFGIAGLIGAGRTEVIETVFGIRAKSQGQIFVDGKEVSIHTPRDAKVNKMALLTEDRRITGIFPMLTVFQNVIIANILKYVKKSKMLNHKKAIEDVNRFVSAIQIKTPSIYQKVENLSGGNQQKVLVARWLLTEPEILFLDEPTRGIDVGAKAEIHRLITNLAGQGKSIIMVSSELPEVMGMSDRILVMHEGKVTAILDNTKELTQEEIMTYATGQSAKLPA